MDAIPEEPSPAAREAFDNPYRTNAQARRGAAGGSTGSLTSSTGSLGRTGIKMGSVALQPAARSVQPKPLSRPGGWPFRPLDPTALLEALPSPPRHTIGPVLMQPLPMQEPKEEEIEEEEEEEEESDWEKEVTNNGEVFHLVSFSDQDSRAKRLTTSSEERGGGGGGGPESSKSGKLSRLVRRRESRRDRLQAAKEVPSVVLKTPSTNAMLARPNRTNNSYESSDNDSSTYGQIKTFEAFFEASNLDESVAAAVVQEDRVSNGGNSSESSRDATEIHEVTLKFQAKALKAQLPHFQMVLHADNPANQGLLLEALLGIVAEKRPADRDSSVVVAGYISDSPAAKMSDKVHIGDIIRSLDGHHVSMESANTYLMQKLSKSSSSSTGKVKLILQRPVGPALKTIDNQDDILRDVADVEEAVVRPPPTYLNMVMGQGPSPEDVERMLAKLPHMALYMTRQGVTENSPEMADVLFQYPQDDASPLVRVRGIFSTLCQLLAEVVHSKPVVSSLLIPGKDESQTPDHLVHVAYAEEREDLLVLALPASKCLAKDASQLLRDTVRVLRLRHGTLSKAFSTSRRDIHQFFSSLFLDTLIDVEELDKKPQLDLTTLMAPSMNVFETSLPASQWLNLPSEIRFQIEDAMNQFESADFQEYSDEFYDLPREFSILGSCLFHRGFIVANHCCRDDMVDMFLWLRHKHLLRHTRSHPFQRVVLWHEVHPTRRKLAQLSKNNSDEADYDEPDGRTFMLVVGLGYQLLGVLLETGGCTAQPSGTVRPDPFYVDQGANTLEHLHEMGIPIVCERWLTLPSNPDLLDVDALYRVAARAKKLDLSAASTANTSGGVILHRTKSLDYSSSSTSAASECSGGRGRQNDDRPDSELSEEMQTAFRGDEKDTEQHPEPTEEDSSLWELHRSGQRSRINFSEVKGSVRSGGSAAASSSVLSTTSTRSGIEDCSTDVVTYQVSRLTVAAENTLLHYLHLDVGEGVFLAPLKVSSGQLQSSLLDNFRAAAQIIHSTFQMALRHRESLRSSSTPGDTTGISRAWINKSLVAVKEQAMLFRWSPVEGLPMLSYWVCGRLFLSPNPRECYVAHYETAPQQMVELAFRLAHGMQI